MGQSLDQILPQLSDGSSVGVTIVSNQDNGIAGYAVGSLTFKPATVGSVVGGGGFRPSHLDTSPGHELTFYFSDRLLDLPPTPGGGQFANTIRQPFSATATEKLGVSLALGINKTMRLSVFGSQSNVNLSAMGNLLVGLGPSLGNSGPGVFVVAFTGFGNPPR